MIRCDAMRRVDENDLAVIFVPASSTDVSRKVSFGVLIDGRIRYDMDASK